MDYDILVVGGGIAGMESSLTLADMGLRVLLVEKQPSIGGKMILLSKVFPTLDCASCIATPKMAGTANHPGIQVLVNAEVEDVVPEQNGGFKAKVVQKPTFVDPAACTGCGQCETACTVALPDEYNSDLIARRAAHIAFPQAVPKKAVITRYGSSPCNFACPAGVKAHGYVSLVRSGSYEQAFLLHMEDAPLPGSLSRACYAPCEGECTRGGLEGPVPIRAIKRFMVDRYYEKYPSPPPREPVKSTGKHVAIVGSGPAGLSAAYFLSLSGHSVTIYEAAEQPGGMLRYGIPPYRLPKDVLDRDIANITSLGVTIETGRKVGSIKELQSSGFDAFFVAPGTMESVRLNVEGENLDGVVDCMHFLGEANTKLEPRLDGKKVVVVGGGNAAIDSARMALRLGADSVAVLYRRTRAEMPAHEWEVDAALAEGVELDTLKAPTRFVGEKGRLTAFDAISMKLGEPDSSGRRRPIPVEGSEKRINADLIILAVGLRPGSTPFASEIEVDDRKRIVADPVTLQTSLPNVFAGGDAVTGPSMIVKAIAQGKRAAFFMDRFLRGLELDGIDFDKRLSVIDKADVMSKTDGISMRSAMRMEERDPKTRARNTDPVEIPFDEQMAREQASRCLDCGGCSECHECIHACPANAIDFSIRAQERTIQVGSVIVATGFRLFSAAKKPTYGYGRYPNVVDAMQMDRILAPTRPYNGVVRPSDGKEPSNIAFVLCTGSRDCSVDNRLCSQVCCMYSIKQAQLIMGALPLADITIYYIDVRAFGKGYEEFYQQAKGMGIYFVKGRVALISQQDNGDLEVQYEDMADGGMKKAVHDLVVLSVGLLPNPEAFSLVSGKTLEPDSSSAFVLEPNIELEPGRTTIDGIFVAGTASASRDIPDTILHANAAAAQAAAYVAARRSKS